MRRSARKHDRIENHIAEVAELADARDSKSREVTLMWVRFPPSAVRLHHSDGWICDKSDTQVSDARMLTTRRLRRASVLARFSKVTL